MTDLLNYPETIDKSAYYRGLKDQEVFMRFIVLDSTTDSGQMSRLSHRYVLSAMI